MFDEEPSNVVIHKHMRIVFVELLGEVWHYQLAHTKLTDHTEILLITEIRILYATFVLV